MMQSRSLFLLTQSNTTVYSGVSNTTVYSEQSREVKEGDVKPVISLVGSFPDICSYLTCVSAIYAWISAFACDKPAKRMWRPVSQCQEEEWRRRKDEEEEDTTSNENTSEASSSLRSEKSAMAANGRSWVKVHAQQPHV